MSDCAIRQTEALSVVNSDAADLTLSCAFHRRNPDDSAERLERDRLRRNTFHAARSTQTRTRRLRTRIDTFCAACPYCVRNAPYATLAQHLTNATP